MAKIDLTCEVCGKAFSREKGEVNRNRKLGRRVYCSLACVGRDNNDHLDEYKKSPPPPNCRTTTDELSPFRWHLRNIRRRQRDSELTLRDLKERWDYQKGQCPFTGWQLLNPIDSRRSRLPHTIDRASVDRIDSSKPYTKDNIQFVSMMAQFAKNSWSDEDVYRFCEAVVTHQSC